MTLVTNFGKHEHNQNVPSEAWVIEHNLGQYPVISVFLDIHGKTQTVLPYSIEHPSKNKCIIKFTQPRVGYAHLV